MNQEQQKQTKSTEASIDEGTSSQKDQKITMFLHGLHPFTSINDIREAFKPLCPVYNIKFNQAEGKEGHKGYAFFDIDSRSVAEELIKKTHILKGRQVHCYYRTENLEDIKKVEARRIFVGGIMNCVKDDDLKDAFEVFGGVKAAYQIKSIEGQPKGFGYVDFFSADSAQRAVKSGVTKVNGKRVDIRPFKKKNGREKKRRYYSDNSDNNGFVKTTFGQDALSGYLGNGAGMGMDPCMSAGLAAGLPALDQNPLMAWNNQQQFQAYMMSLFQSGMMMGASLSNNQGFNFQLQQPMEPLGTSDGKWSNLAHKSGHRQSQNEENKFLKKVMKHEKKFSIGEIDSVNNSFKIGFKNDVFVGKGKGGKLAEGTPKKKTVVINFDDDGERNTLKEIERVSRRILKLEIEGQKTGYYFRMACYKGRRRLRRRKRRRRGLLA